MFRLNIRGMPMGFRASNWKLLESGMVMTKACLCTTGEGGFGGLAFCSRNRVKVELDPG